MTIAPTVAEIAALRETLSALCDDATVRFAMLDLDAPADVAVPAPAPSPAARAADAALDARRAELEARQVELLAERGLRLDGAGEIVPIVAPVPAPLRRAAGRLPSNQEIAARRAAAAAAAAPPPGNRCAEPVLEAEPGSSTILA